MAFKLAFRAPGIVEVGTGDGGPGDSGFEADAEAAGVLREDHDHELVLGHGMLLRLDDAEGVPALEPAIVDAVGVGEGHSPSQSTMSARTNRNIRQRMQITMRVAASSIISSPICSALRPSWPC